MMAAFSKDVRENCAAALILFVIVTVAFAPFAYGDRTLMSSAQDTASLFITGGEPQPPASNVLRVLDPGAGGWQTEPELFLEHDQVRHEHVAPLWNPYVAYGQPLAADMQAQPFFPLTWLVVASRSVRAYDWFIILRFYVAALFGYLYLRMFMRIPAAIAGGVGFAFSGYFLLYYNMPHISVECLIPALLWAMELLVRRRTATSVSCLALVEMLVIFGGMPESALLAFAFAYAYVLVRVTSDCEQRSVWLPTLLRLVGASVLGIGLSACLLLPFTEFVRLSVNQHDARVTGVVSGVAHDDYAFGFVPPYLMPLIYGPPFSNVFTGFSGWTTVRGWFGISQSFFALVAIANLASQLRRRSSEMWSPAAFFLGVTVVLLLKRFGCPFVNWIGTLPGFDLITWPKYEEAIVAFCVAGLAAIGIERISAGRVRGYEVWAATLIVLITLTATAGVYRPEFLALSVHRFFYAGSLAMALLVLAVASGSSWLALRSMRYGDPTRFARLAATVVAADALLAYFVPMWYVVDSPAPLARSPLAGTAYVDWVHGATATNHARFFGEDGLLYPEWSSVFGISDVRDLNALYDYRYLAFVRAFLKPVPDEDFHDRFVGVGAPDFRDTLSQRFLQLSSVAYVGSVHRLGGDPSLLSLALAEHPEDHSPTLRSGSYEINGSRRDITFMHVPRMQYPVPTLVPRDAHNLRFAYAMAPDVWTDPALRCGDGVTFVLQLREATGSIRTLLRAYINPKSSVADRKWFDSSVPIGRWAGQRVTLLFSTLPGPSGLTCADWSIWSGVAFDGHLERPDDWPFEPVFRSQDATIYRFAKPLPRLAVVTSVKRASSDAEALAILTSPAFNPARQAVVTSDANVAMRTFAQFGAPNLPVNAGQIYRYASQLVSGIVDARSPALVVLNDTAYPGWVASVDGRAVPIFTVNYLFRGVVVPAGHHTVEFRYRPVSFEVGVVITLIFLLVAVLYPVCVSRMKKHVKA